MVLGFLGYMDGLMHMYMCGFNFIYNLDVEGKVDAHIFTNPCLGHLLGDVRLRAAVGLCIVSI